MAMTTRFATLLCTAATCMTIAGCTSSPGANDTMHEHHTIDYIEFSVLDLAEAKRFYATAFDWSFTDYGPKYAGIQRQGGGEVGGMEQVEAVAKGGPLVVLYSSDLEATVRAVIQAGGEIAKDPFDFPGGRRFHFRDPSGNELAVWGEAPGSASQEP